MNVGQITVDILSGIDQVLAIRPQWEQLYAASAASPYSCFDWFVTDMKYLGAPEAVRVGVLIDTKGILAIVPLEFTRERIGPIRQTVLRFAGGGWAQRNTAIVAERAMGAAIVPEVLLQVWQRQRHWALCCLNKIPAGSPLLAYSPAGSPAARKIKIVRSLMGRSIIVELPDSWPAYRRGLGPAHRKNISRRLNAMNRSCQPRLVRLGLDQAPDEEALAKLIQDALAVSRKSWQGSSAQGRAVSNGDVADFFAEVSRKMARRGMLDLSVLYAGAEPISFIWGPARPPNTCIAKLGFDPAFKAHSPGLVHLAMLISDSIDRRLSQIDMGMDVFDYKSKWSKQRRDLYELRCYPPSLVGMALRRWRRLKQSDAPQPIQPSKMA